MMTFELLALDTGDASTIQTESNLLHSLLGNGRLWQHPRLDYARIVDGDLAVAVVPVAADPELQATLNKAFLIRATGSITSLEPLREPLAEHLKCQSFDRVYILADEVSESIACQVYPLIYKVENLLRAYVIKFMTTRLGPQWFEKTATSELNKKIHQRKGNEEVFSRHVDIKAYLIDFEDLGQIIYAHSSGCTTKEEIIRMISEVEETPEAIRALKAHLQSNYQKFFKETFKDKGFQAKWEALQKIRHRVAHNNLFTSADLDRAKEIAQELRELIQEAIRLVDEVTLAPDEKEAIKESLVDRGLFDVITEDKFLEELREAEAYFSLNNAFVGLQHFVKTHLGERGYDYRASYELVQRLEKQRRIEIYKVDNPHGDHPTSAIRIPKAAAT
jgi:Apea-like HEPN